jgi:hypothetical protein
VRKTGVSVWHVLQHVQASMHTVLGSWALVIAIIGATFGALLLLRVVSPIRVVSDPDAELAELTKVYAREYQPRHAAVEPIGV